MSTRLIRRHLAVEYIIDTRVLSVATTLVTMKLSIYSSLLVVGLCDACAILGLSSETITLKSENI